MNRRAYDNPMVRQVWSLPDLIAAQYADLEPKTRHLLSTPEIFSLRKLYLTGCGDSFAACLAAREAFEKLARLPVDIVPAIELSRHRALLPSGHAPHDPALIAISNSGQVARVYEAAKRINHLGGFTIGVTGRRSSMLGQETSRILELDIPPFESAPGVRSYLVSVMALLLLAIRIGEVRGHMTMDEANGNRRELAATSGLLRGSLSPMEKSMFAVAHSWRDYNGFDFIGAGTDYASALYGQAKIFEATGKYAMLVNTEEWLHLNYFTRDANNTGAVLVVDGHSASMSRARETAEHIVGVGRPLLIVTSAGAELFPPQARLARYPQTSRSWLSPLVNFIPTALMAGYMAALLGEEYGRGARENWSACQGGATTRDSAVIIPEMQEAHHA